MKRWFFVSVGFVLGVLVAGVFSASLSEAQSAFGKKESGGFSFEDMRPAVPASFGSLVAVDGIKLYFQGAGGVVYVVRPRTGNDLDTQVTVIPRS